MILKLVGGGRGGDHCHTEFIKYFGIKCVIQGLCIIILLLNNVLLRDSSHLSNLL